jgi:hypothetical protein
MTHEWLTEDTEDFPFSYGELIHLYITLSNAVLRKTSKEQWMEIWMERQRLREMTIKEQNAEKPY